MNLSMDSDETAIMTAAAEALRAEMPVTQGRFGIDAQTQERQGLELAAALGWMGIAVSDACGGAEGTLLDAVLLALEFGRGLAPAPVLGGLLGARVAEASGEPTLARDIVLARRKVAIGGMQGIAFGGEDANVVVIVEATGARLHEIANATPLVSLDPTTTMARLELGACLADAPGEWWAYERDLLIAAEQAGIAEAALEQSVEYAKLREQFGRAIGSFQAVRHRCADMALRCARVRAQVLLAGVAMRDGLEDAFENVLAAAIVAHDAANTNARANIFIHGAQGVTAENAAHLYLKRAIALGGLGRSAHAIKDALADLASHERNFSRVS